MTIERANIAFEKGEAVIYKGSEYRCITAIIKRRKNLRSLRDRMTPQSRYTYSCEILDKNGGSVIVCLPDDIEPKHNNIPVLTPELELVDKLEDTERGDNGFGSSGR